VHIREQALLRELLRGRSAKLSQGLKSVEPLSKSGNTWVISPNGVDNSQRPRRRCTGTEHYSRCPRHNPEDALLCSRGRS
jgi:hypothetical protein